MPAGSATPLSFGPSPEPGALALDLGRVLTTRLLVVGNSGSGKSHALRLLLEGTAGRVVQSVIDPEGEFYTLRQLGDSHPYVHVGVGADVTPDAATAGPLSQALVRAGASAILDLSEMPRSDRDTFAAAYVRGLLDLPAADRRHVLLVVDEAQTLAPEGPATAAGGALVDAATRGRKRGVGLVCATQRLALLDKSLVSQLTNVLVGRTSLGNDQRRAADVLGFSPGERRGLGELSAGEFFAFGPALSADVVAVRTAPKTATAHPSSSDLRPPEVPTPAALAGLVEELRALAPSAAPSEAGGGARSDADRDLASERDELRRVLTERTAERDRLEAALDTLRETVRRAVGDLATATASAEPVPEVVWEDAADEPGRRMPTASRGVRSSRGNAAGSTAASQTDRSRLPDARRRILDALAGLEAVGLIAVGRRNLAAFSSQSPKSSAYGAHVAALFEAGLIEYPAPGQVALTSAGRSMADAGGEPRSLAELHRRWLDYLDVQPRSILSVLIASRAEGEEVALDREQVAAMTGYSARSSAFGAAIAELASLGLVDYPRPGAVAASDILFPPQLR